MSSLANSNLSEEEKLEYRNQAESEALFAIQYDNNNRLAKAYYAEILIDQFKHEQANDYITQARKATAKDDGCLPHPGLYLRNVPRIQPRH